MEFIKTNNEKDLGILIDGHLNFGDRMNHIVSKANRQLSLIKRSFVIRDRTWFLLLYKSTVLVVPVQLKAGI